MNRFFGMPCVILAVALLVSLASVSAADDKDKDKAKAPANEKQTKLTLNVEGVECANCAKVITNTLAESQLKVSEKIEPNSSGPSRVLVSCSEDCDLGAAAAKVNEAQTPHAAKVPPKLTLVLFAPLNEQAASSAIAACKKIEGVEGESCRAQPDKGEIQLTISGEKKLTLAQILSALQDAGIKAQTTESRPEKSTKAS